MVMLITLLLLLLLLRRTATGAEHSVRYVDVLSTRVNVTDPVCDLGVMINSQLSLVVCLNHCLEPVVLLPDLTTLPNLPIADNSHHNCP